MSLRRLPFAALVLTLLLAHVPALQAGPEKVSPLLRKYTSPGLTVAYDHARSFPASGVQSLAGGQMISCLVRGDVSRAQLEELGVAVGTRAGDVYTARVPVGRLVELSDLPGIVRIDPAHRVKLTLDNATLDTHVQPEVHGTGAPAWTGNTGVGILVGNVDSGVDYTHEDFKDPLGNTRFDRIWDQTATGTPPSGYTYGREWSNAEIQAGSATVTNPDGHGSHVLGILGGDGSSTGTSSAPAYTFVGVAPQATLIHVKTDFTDAGIIDGCNWIFDRAAALGVPAVVNLSLGNQYGPHDGTDSFEAGLDALTGSGRVIVTSASNDRGLGIHARGTIPTNGQPSSLTFDFEIDSYGASPGTQNDIVVFSAWYAGTDDYTITVTGPGGDPVTATKGNLVAFDTNDGAIQIENGYSTPPNGDTEVFIAIFDYVPNHTPSPGAWTMTFDRASSSASNIDAWMYYSSMGARFTTQVTDDVTIGNPACAPDLIAVGAYATKINWPSRNGGTYQWNPLPTLYDLADFSGRGPTRTGGQKPDITAPGFGVVSVLSDDVPINSSTIPLILPGDVHWIQAGTSMSSPMVAGLAALIMAKEGALTPAEIKSRMDTYATTDGFTGATWNADWGWGKMNAEPADVLGPTVAVTSPDGGEMYATGSPITIEWTASDNFGVAGVDLYYSDDGGATYPNLIASGETNDGTYEWATPPASGSMLRVKVLATDTVDNTGEDASDGDFAIGDFDTTPPDVAVTAPNGGESFLEGMYTTVTWSASDTGTNAPLAPLGTAATVSGVDSVAIWYSLDNGTSWTLEASGLENSGSYTWKVPGASSDSALVRVGAWDPDENYGEDVSDAVFTIGAPTAVGPGAIPPTLVLAQNRPNPFRGASATRIAFGLPEDGSVRIRIFDTRGSVVATVADGFYPAGSYEVPWNGRGSDGTRVSSGLYFYRLEALGKVLSRKILVVH